MNIKLRNAIRNTFAATLISWSSTGFSESVTVQNLTVLDIAVDTTGNNKFIHVSPNQLQCFAVGSSVMLLNDVGENAKMAYSAFLTALAAGMRVEVVHDGTSYCKILRVKIVK